MPTTGANGSKISWATNNEEFIASNGQVTRPAYSAGDVVVTLTATLTKGSAKVTKTFDVVVKAALPTANELLAEAKQKLEEKITNINNLIENTKETLENANENAKEEIENKLADLNSLLETTKALLEKANSNNSQEIEDKINEAQNNMQEAVKKLASDLQNAEQELANAVASGDAAIEEKIEELKALLETTKAFLEITEENSRKELEQAILEAQATLQNAIDKIQEELENVKNGVEDTLDSTDQLLPENVFNLQELIEKAMAAFKSSDENVKSELATLINEATKALGDAAKELEEKIKDFFKPAEPTADQLLTEAKNALTLNVRETTENITLPTTGKNNAKITWTSNNAAISNTGVVTRPVYPAGDVRVTLTATLTLEGAKPLTKRFTVIVKATDATTEQLLAEAKEALELVTKTTVDIELPTTGANGSEISWSSSNADVIAKNGTVKQPTYTEGSKTVTLTATIKINGKEVTKKFEIKVPAAAATDKELLEEAAKEFKFEVTETTENITLPTDAIHNVSVTWSSSNTDVIDVIDNNGTVIRPKFPYGNIDVVLTATFTLGEEAPITKTYTVNVKAEEAPTKYTAIKVTDINMLRDGATILLTYNDTVAAGELNKKYLTMVEFNPNREALTLEQKVVTLVKSGDNWLMKMDNKYLSYSGSSTDVSLSEETKEASQWTISVDAKGNATIKNVGTPERLLQYNARSPRFACYKTSSNQFNPVIYLVSGNLTPLGPTDIEIVTKDKTELTLSSGPVTENITLPSKGVNGSDITWESNKPEVISNEGVVVRPEYGKDDEEVKLTATLTKGKVTETQEFTVVVKAAEQEQPEVPGAPTVLATFELGANGSATHADGNKVDPSKSYTDGAYTLTLTSCSNVYDGARDAKGNSCLKFGKTDVVGSMKFTVPENVTSVTIYVAKYKSNTTKIKINSTPYTVSNASNDGLYDEYEIDTTTTKTITFTTVSGGERAMVNTIKFIGNEVSDSEQPEVPAHEHTKCPECDKCTAPDCNGTAEEKCPGHPFEEPAVTNKTVAELIALTTEKDAKYTVTGKVVLWGNKLTSTDTAATKYGNFVLEGEDGNKIVVYGATATATALTFDTTTGKYIYSNAEDFLTNELTSTISIGDIVELIVVRRSYKSDPQLNAIVTKVTKVEQEGPTHTCIPCPICTLCTDSECNQEEAKKCAGHAAAEVSITKTMASYGWKNETSQKTFNLDDNISVSIDGGTYSGNYYSADSAIRIYATDSPAGSITITAKEGYKIKSISFKLATGTYAFLQLDGATVTNGQVVEINAATATFKSVKNGDKGKQVRIAEITVVYVAE